MQRGCWTEPDLVNGRVTCTGPKPTAAMVLDGVPSLQKSMTDILIGPDQNTSGRLTVGRLHASVYKGQAALHAASWDVQASLPRLVRKGLHLRTLIQASALNGALHSQRSSCPLTWGRRPERGGSPGGVARRAAGRCAARTR